MAQISSLKVTPQQNGGIFLSEVVIRPDLEQYWFDALGKFAGLMRLQLGMTYVVSIENEKGFVNSAGELVVTVDVNSEGILQMAFPAGTWEWRGSEQPAPARV